MKQAFFIAILFAGVALSGKGDKTSVIKSVSLCKCLGKPDATFTVFWGKGDTTIQVQTGKLNRQRKRQYPEMFDQNGNFNWGKIKYGTICAITGDSLFITWYHFKIYK